MVDVALRLAQGGRPYMEDFARVERSVAGRQGVLYVGIFDGHGGASVSHRASQRVHEILAVERRHGDPWRETLVRAFRAFDEEVASEPCGATAAVLILDGTALTVANVGDTHIAVISRDAATFLTTDHRLANEAEYERVVAAGARIWGPYACLPDGRGLMPTRALGDREFRSIGITAEPSIAERTLGDENEWIVAGTDGLWDGVALETVPNLVARVDTAEQAAEMLVGAALAANTDNVTVVAVRRP